MSITSDQLKLIKVLRETTGVSIRLCKKALEDNHYSLEVALDMLRANTANSIFVSKSDRTTEVSKAFGVKRGQDILLLTLQTETDFVLKADAFNNLVKELIDICFTKGNIGKVTNENFPESIIALEEAMLSTGEKISIDTVYVVKAQEITDTTNYYVHNNRLACAVVLSAGTEEQAYKLAVHTVAFKPSFMYELDPAFKQDLIAKKQCQRDIDSFVKSLEEEYVLTKQSFYAMPSITVGKWMQDNNIMVRSFHTNFRLQLSEN
jgi:translation elongation factor EF-Ts